MLTVLHQKRSWGILFIFQLLFFFLISKSKFFTEKSTVFFEWRKDFQQSLFSGVEFSVGDVFYLVLGMTLVFFIGILFFKKWRKKIVLIVFIILNVFYFVYQTFWGMVYFEPPIIERLSPEKINLDETKKRYLDNIKICNYLREMANEDNNGIFKVKDIGTLKKEIITQQNNLPKNLNSKKSNHIISIKPSLFEKVISETGILGYYNPFTAEAQYNPNLPDTMIPFTLAHETAHQLGYAREQEASFIGFLISESSHNIDLKYSTSIFILKQLNRYIVHFDPEFLEENKDLLSEKVKKDLKYETNFRNKTKGLTKNLFLKSNDLFLKSNQQKGRVTYSYFIELFLRYPSKRTT